MTITGMAAFWFFMAVVAVLVYLGMKNRSPMAGLFGPLQGKAMEVITEASEVVKKYDRLADKLLEQQEESK